MDFLREVTRYQHRGCIRWGSRREMTRVPAGERAWAYWCPDHGAAQFAALDAGCAEETGAGESTAGEAAAAS